MLNKKRTIKKWISNNHIITFHFDKNHNKQHLVANKTILKNIYIPTEEKLSFLNELTLKESQHLDRCLDIDNSFSSFLNELEDEIFLLSESHFCLFISRRSPFKNLISFHEFDILHFSDFPKYRKNTNSVEFVASPNFTFVKEALFSNKKICISFISSNNQQNFVFFEPTSFSYFEFSSPTIFSIFSDAELKTLKTNTVAFNSILRKKSVIEDMYNNLLGRDNLYPATITFSLPLNQI